MKQKPKKKNHIPQRKSLSQVFLKVSWPCEEIAQKLHDEGVRSVLEIGPGSGALTKELLKAGINVLAVEKDDRFAGFLQVEFEKKFSDKEVNFKVLNQDILEVDLGQTLEENPEITAIVGNIPYAISTPIISHILPHLKKIKLATLLVQLEFAERLASPPGRKSYGSLSVYTQLRSQVHLDFIVEKECFTPIPKVDSAVISFSRRNPEFPDGILKKIEKITKTVFSQRRKKLSNSLKPFLSTLDSSDLDIDLTRRCDTISPEEYVEIAKSLYKES